jgi:phosphoesterase RecJ-like protein|tara:strand:- start:12258 stop:13262 length:1005 start_codon:yes stop_codon:yes gene_type:complete
MLDWKSLHNTINSSARILLSTHENPDGDGLGSATAVYHYLTKIGKDCRLIIISDLPKEYQFLNLDNIIETYDSNLHDDWISQADLAIIFDVGDFNRLRQVGEKISANSIKAINFDHHPDLKDKRFSDNYIQITAAATGEMVYDFLKSVNVNLTLAMANGIYTAVMTDTGSFCYSNTNQKCHQIAIECLDVGVNTSQIYQTVYENRTAGQVKLLAGIINNLNFSDNHELAWFSISQKMMKNANAINKDIDGFSDFVRSIQGVEVALMVFENTNGTCRINFRSKGKYIINTIAKSLGGGGHKFAAGAMKNGNLEDVLNDVLTETRIHLSKIDSNFS